MPLEPRVSHTLDDAFLELEMCKRLLLDLVQQLLHCSVRFSGTHDRVELVGKQHQLFMLLANNG
mgnify:CR=1 FL=1